MFKTHVPSTQIQSWRSESMDEWYLPARLKLTEECTSKLWRKELSAQPSPSKPLFAIVQTASLHTKREGKYTRAVAWKTGQRGNWKKKEKSAMQVKTRIMRQTGDTTPDVRTFGIWLTVSNKLALCNAFLTTLWGVVLSTLYNEHKTSLSDIYIYSFIQTGCLNTPPSTKSNPSKTLNNNQNSDQHYKKTKKQKEQRGHANPRKPINPQPSYPMQSIRIPNWNPVSAKTQIVTSTPIGSGYYMLW